MTVAAPFLIHRSAFEGSRVHLLPTGNVVIVIPHTTTLEAVRLVLPHRDVVIADAVGIALSLSPNFVKCLIGEPRLHLGQTLRADEHPMLAPFAGVATIEDALELLRDLRASLAVTPDEEDFLQLWRTFTSEGHIPPRLRRDQRLCVRYAGQPPTTLNLTSRLARSLDADNATGLYNGLGHFADASHYGRVCRAFTGRTPAEWKNMSRTFY